LAYHAPLTSAAAMLATSSPLYNLAQECPGLLEAGLKEDVPQTDEHTGHEHTGRVIRRLRPNLPVREGKGGGSGAQLQHKLLAPVACPAEVSFEGGK
jgi:hypothetical protein